MQHEADEAKRVLDEIECKRRVRKGERSKVEAEITKLQEQINTGDFDLTEEEQSQLSSLRTAADGAKAAVNRAEASLESSQEKRDVPSLEEEIRSKEMRLNGLGIFKGKEKRNFSRRYIHFL